MTAKRPSTVVLGTESAGKSQLVASLTGRSARVENFRGSTVWCERYRGSRHDFVDTPGILRRSDTLTTALALRELAASDLVLLVIRATRLDQDLDALLHLVEGRCGAVVVTFWDKVSGHAAAREALATVRRACGVPVVAIDARRLGRVAREAILSGLESARTFATGSTRAATGLRVEPTRSVFDRSIAGPLTASWLLMLPAISAVCTANAVAGAVESSLESALGTAAEAGASWPPLIGALVAGRYGLLTMAPLLLVWALPTVLVYALVAGAYKASGLIDRISLALHPITRRIGLSDRDVLRVVMGFGCNVPAVTSTRACSRCSRSTCIATIAFGSACSYQLGATLAVFAAVGRPGLVVPYLLYLALTTAIFARLTSSAAARSSGNELMLEGPSYLTWPSPGQIMREARGIIVPFLVKAMPIFIVISMVASLLDWSGGLSRAAGLLAPVLAPLRLPDGAALPIVLSAIRKDGIILLADPQLAATLTPGQVLTAVYLAGLLVPCLVTVITIARETSLWFAGKLMARQIVAAIAFSLVLARACQLMGW